MQTIQLPKASLSTLVGHQAQWIECEHGMIWLSDDGHDVVLERGQSWQVLSDHTVVIEALTQSRLAIKDEQYRATSLFSAVQQQVHELIHQLVRKPEIKTV
ncbi:DUF2917 domain-containing protein [Chitinibacter fontanus]|uniref:DUF2917 domain-containing protein n=1 Tax=Chitinibacter fontanus TaxID=1737446 RepID=A0A7D5VBK3_9NEIS|nr:DUF2917 domain-containing protein [Chitinibacter fontanus]QLI82971.1 DUF2917 domain-containing protein [Chitinibacter fontanus]